MTAALLADQFRCVAYDLPAGNGDSACLRKYTHADLVADSFAILDHAGAGQAYVLGSSFGSTIALAAMRAMPEASLEQNASLQPPSEPNLTLLMSSGDRN